jgi:flagellar hook-length control protein FliK
LTQTGTAVSFGPLEAAAPNQTRGGKTGSLEQYGENNKFAGKKGKAVAKRFSELLNKARNEQEAAGQQAKKSLMGKRRGQDAADQATAEAALAGAAALVAPVKPEAKPEAKPADGQAQALTPGKVEEGEGAAISKIAVGPDAAEAVAAGALLEALAERRETPAQGPAGVPPRLSGSGPGGQAGRPPDEAEGQAPGPEKGSITQVKVTDGTERTGSQNQGPGTGIPGLSLDDLAVVADGPDNRGGGSERDASGSQSGDAGAGAGAGTETAQAPSQAGEVDLGPQLSPLEDEADLQEPSPPVSEANSQQQSSQPAGSLATPAQSGPVRDVRVDNLADPAPLRSAIVDHVEVASKGGNPTVKLILQPEHLGEVQVQVSLVNGQVNAKVQVDNPAVREAVQQQMEALRVALIDQGVKIDKLEVDISNQDTRQGRENPGWDNPRHGDTRQGRENPGWNLPQPFRGYLAGTEAGVGDGDGNGDGDGYRYGHGYGINVRA